jgi:hypothetical protein
MHWCQVGCELEYSVVKSDCMDNNIGKQIVEENYLLKEKILKMKSKRKMMAIRHIALLKARYRKEIGSLVFFCTYFVCRVCSLC